MIQQSDPLLTITLVQRTHFCLCQVAPFKAPLGKAIVHCTCLAMRPNVVLIGRDDSWSDDDSDKENTTDVMPRNGILSTLRRIGGTGTHSLAGSKQALPRLAWDRRARKVSASRQ